MQYHTIDKEKASSLLFKASSECDEAIEDKLCRLIKSNGSPALKEAVDTTELEEDGIKIDFSTDAFSSLCLFAYGQISQNTENPSDDEIIKAIESFNSELIDAFDRYYFNEKAQTAQKLENEMVECEDCGAMGFIDSETQDFTCTDNCQAEEETVIVELPKSIAKTIESMDEYIEQRNEHYESNNDEEGDEANSEVRQAGEEISYIVSEAIAKKLIREEKAKVFIYHYHSSASLDKGNIVNKSEANKKDLHLLISEALGYGYDIQVQQSTLTDEAQANGDVILFFSNKRMTQS